MSKTASLSTIIDDDIKRALVAYCKARGLKIRHVIEQALLEQLEDAIDLDAYIQRRDEEAIDFDTILKRLNP